MISIEAYRACIGRFSGKARFISQSTAFKKVELHNSTFVLLLMLLQLVIYGLVVLTIYLFYIYWIALMLLSVTYGYSYWIIKQGSEMLWITFHKIAKRRELMRKPSLPIKGQPLIPGNYLNTFVFDGRCNDLSASVLDGRDGKSDNIDNENIYKMIVTISLHISCITAML